ncbi:MAG: hypothetical protein ACI9UA_002702, partial [Pseudoalteromonas tetraodonis]
GDGGCGASGKQLAARDGRFGGVLHAETLRFQDADGKRLWGLASHEGQRGERYVNIPMKWYKALRSTAVSFSDMRGGVG